MPPDQQNLTRGYAIALAAALVLATTAIFIRHLTENYHMPALVLAFWREVMVALTLLAILAIFQPNRIKLNRQYLPYLLSYGLVLALTRGEQLAEARELLAPMRDFAPNNIVYGIAEAEIDIAAKRYDAAIRLLENMLALSPGNHPTTMALGRAYFEGGYFAKADKLLTRHARNHPGDANLWYLLAEVQGKGGNILGLHQSRAEYFMLNGAMQQAIEQLNLALPMATNAVTAERIHTRIDYFRNIEEALKNFG